METLETLKTFRKRKLRIFKSHSAEKSERRDPLGFFNICSVAKYQKKLKGGSFGDIKTFEKKSHKAEKRVESHSAEKLRTFCFGILVKKIGAYARVRTRTLWAERQASHH